MSSSIPRVRLEAARALGRIGYDAATRALEQGAVDPDDWKTAYAAAEALGRLGAQSARGTLERVAATYWYPSVQDAARRALSLLRGTPEPEPPLTLVWPPRCSPSSRTLPTTLASSAGRLSADELEGVTYQAHLDVHYPTGVEPRHVTRSPMLGVRTGDGMLLGVNHGEFGGEVVFLDARGVTTKLVDDTPNAIFRVRAGFVVVAGLSHGGFDRGALHLVRRKAPGRYEAAVWKILPGAAKDAGLLPDGSLAVSCTGGDVIVKPDGRIELAGTCTPIRAIP